MGYNVYSAEYKMATVEEYISHNIKVRDFVKEKGLAISTFFTWLSKYRKAGYQVVKKENKKELIEVTNEVKEIIKEEKTSIFTLETKGMKFTFSINDLKQVLEAINHDWTRTY